MKTDRGIPDTLRQPPTATMPDAAAAAASDLTMTTTDAAQSSEGTHTDTSAALEGEAAREALPAPKVARVVRVAHRFPQGLSLRRDPSAYLLSPASLLTRRAEDFRQLRSQLKMSLGESGVLLVTRPRHGEGRYITALNLSIAIAQEYERVVYVEADFRRPALHTFFEFTAGKGVADLLRQRAPVGEVSEQVLATDVPSLYLLPAGVRSGAPELLESPRMAELVEQLRIEADWTIIDCPPFLSYADARPLIKLVDGVLVVALQGRTREEDLSLLSARLAAAQARVVGAIYVER
ncbi:MAG: CpsD/CapB family tyrosine-protein kinase [Ktedonobacterales bacterium]